MGALADLGKQTIQCKPKHALTSFKFVKDPRPWYVRKDNPGMARLQANLDRDPTIPPGLGALGTKLAAKREGIGTAAVPFPGLTQEELLQEFPDASVDQVKELLKLQTQNQELLKQLQRRRRDMTRVQLNSIGERRASLASGSLAQSL